MFWLADSATTRIRAVVNLLGEVDFNYIPSVPVFDANVALGRRNDRRVSVDTGEATVESMTPSGVQRAVTYSPHAINYDADDGNDWLLELVDGHDASTLSSSAIPRGMI